MDQALIISLGILILGLFGLSWFAGSDAPFVPTKTQDLAKILKKGGVKKGKIFYELGSGDGRVVLEAGYLGAEGNGVEQSWIRVWYSRFKTKKQNLKNIYFFHGNIFDRHYYPADVVYIYMLQNCVNKLEKILQKELKKGAVVITQKYHFKKWRPYQKIDNFWYYKV